MRNKIFGKILLGLLVIFLLAQFIPRPEKNNGTIKTAAYIGNSHQINPEVEKILQTSCFDCHSNKTTYPWYTSIQPVAWWCGDHVTDGKKHLNFSEFGNIPLARQFHKLEEIQEEVESGEMPNENYTFIHRSTKLTPEQQKQLADWSKTARAVMSSKYPSDSLVMKRKK